MSDLTDMLVRAAGVSSVAGTVGASIGGSVTAVFGPAAAGGAAVGGRGARLYYYLKILVSPFL